MIKFREQYVEPGDPVRAAKVIIDIAGSDDPPLRLLLGSDALTGPASPRPPAPPRREKWADVTVSTDYPAQASPTGGATPFRRGPSRRRSGQAG